MAMIQCSECGGKLSTQAATCPHCGATGVSVPHGDRGAPDGGAGSSAEWAQYRQLLATQDEAKKASQDDAQSGGGFVSFMKWAAGLFVVAWMLSLCTGKSGVDAQPGSSSVGNAGLTHSSALTVCQMAMKKIAKVPDKAEIPYVLGSEDSGFFYFAWGGETKHMWMRNGLGLEVLASGTCYVSKSQRRITQLTLNGETII